MFNNIQICWSCDGKYIITTTKQHDSTYDNCTLTLWQVLYNNKNDSNSKLEIELTPKASVVGSYRYAFFNQYNQIIAFNSRPQCIELMQNDNKLSFIGSFVLNNNNNENSWTCAIEIDFSLKTIACATKSREMLIIDANNLKEINRFKTDASSNLWCVRWLPNSNDIMFSPKHGIIEVWDTVKGEKKFNYNCNQLIKEFNSTLDFAYVIQLSNNSLNTVTFDLMELILHLLCFFL